VFISEPSGKVNKSPVDIVRSGFIAWMLTIPSASAKPSSLFTRIHSIASLRPASFSFQVLNGSSRVSARHLEGQFCFARHMPGKNPEPPKSDRQKERHATITVFYLGTLG